jgi:hypothetical protein
MNKGSTDVDNWADLIECEAMKNNFHHHVEAGGVRTALRGDDGNEYGSVEKCQTVECR